MADGWVFFLFIEVGLFYIVLVSGIQLNDSGIQLSDSFVYNYYSLMSIHFRLYGVFTAACRRFSSFGAWCLLSSCSAQVSHCGGFSCCGAQAPGTQAQYSWRPGLVAL